MKIGILSRKKSLYSTTRLVEAAKKRGHQVSVIDTLRCYISVNPRKPRIHFKSKLLSNYDAVIPRIGSSVTLYGTAVLRQFEMMGVYPLNESVAITRARDKLRSLQLLSRKGIGLPATGFAHSADDIEHLVKMVGGEPLIIKLLQGTQGVGVVLSNNKQTTKSVVQAFLNLKVNIMLQEFIKESAGKDVRCFVIGDEVVGAMLRESQDGDFRSNLHLGGKASPTTLTPLEQKTAIQAARIIGLNMAGVDLLRSDRGPLVTEVNASPGLRGIEQATGLDIADMIIQFLEKNQKFHRTRTKGKG